MIRKMLSKTTIQKLPLILILILLIVLGSITVFAGFPKNAPPVIIVKPKSSTIVNGTYNFSATVTNASNNASLNLSVYLLVSGSWKRLCTSTLNKTTLRISKGNMSCTNATSGIADLTTYTVNFTTYNKSGSFGRNNVTTATVNFDNTAPVCSFTVEPNVKWFSPIGITPTQSSTDTSTLNYTWNLVYPEGGGLSNKTNVSEPTFNLEMLDQEGSYTLGLTVTDASAKRTACTNETVFVKKDTTAEESEVQEEKGIKLLSGVSKPVIIGISAIIGLIVIGVLVYVIYSIVEGSKRKKRR